MPSRREMISMTEAERRAYLAEQTRITIVTNGHNGLPHPVPMNYGIDDEDRIFITTFRKSQKVKNVERDPRATLLVESGVAYHELKSVIAYCNVEIIDDLDLMVANMHRIQRDDALMAAITDETLEQVKATLAKRVMLRFTPFRYVTWDHSKLDAAY